MRLPQKSFVSLNWRQESKTAGQQSRIRAKYHLNRSRYPDLTGIQCQYKSKHGISQDPFSLQYSKERICEVKLLRTKGSSYRTYTSPGALFDYINVDHQIYWD